MQLMRRTRLVLPFADVLWLGSPAAQAATPAEKEPGLDVQFVNVAREAGLNAKIVFGGMHKNKYLLETTGCGAAFYDFDDDGWLDIFLLHGWRLEGFPAGEEPVCYLFENNRDDTFTDFTQDSGLARSGWFHGVRVRASHIHGADGPFITESLKHTPSAP